MNVNLLKFKNLKNTTVSRMFLTLDSDKIDEFTRWGKNIFFIVVWKSNKGEENNRTLRKLKKIFHSNIKMKIGFFYENVSNFEEVSSVFRWCWSVLMINVVATYTTQWDYVHAFTFDPFGSFNVINITGSSADKYFPSKIDNLHGHRINIFLSHDYQTSFLIKNNTSLGGPHGKLCCLMLDKMNATLSVPLDIIKPYDAQTMKQLVYDDRKFDVCPQPVKILSSLTYLNTIEIEKLNIIVPESKAYTVINALNLTVFDEYGYLILIFIILCTVSSLILIRFVQSGKFMIMKSLIETSSLLITANIVINYRKCTKSEMFILLPWTFAGIIITNFVFSVLFSFLTVTTFEPQINTFEDIDRFGCKILAAGRGIAEKIREPIGENLYSKVVIVASKEMSHSFATYNRSVCYLYTDSRIRVILERQKRLNIRGFHVPENYASKGPFSFLIRPDLPYVDKMNYIILRSFDSGLFAKWMSDSYYELTEMKYFEGKDFSDDEQTNSSQPILWGFLSLGWSSSVICFVCELLCNWIFKHMHAMH